MQILFFCWWMFPLSAALHAESTRYRVASAETGQASSEGSVSFIPAQLCSLQLQTASRSGPISCKATSFPSDASKWCLGADLGNFPARCFCSGAPISEQNAALQCAECYRAALLGFRTLPWLCDRKSLRFLCPIFPSIAGRTWVEEKISLSHGDRSLICSRQASLYNQTFLALCSAAYYGKGMLLGIAEDSYKEQGRSEWEGSRVW